MAEQELSIEQRIHNVMNEPPQEAEQPAENPEPAAEQPETQEIEQEAPEQEVSEQEVSESEPEISESETEEVEEVEIGDIREFAEHYGLDVADLYNLPIPITGAEGAAKLVPLGELKDGAQNYEKALQAKLEADKIRERAESEHQRMRQEYEQRLAETGGFIQHAENALKQEYHSVNWQQLEQEDPGRAAMMKQKFAERNGEIQNAKQKAAQQYQQYQAEMQRQQQEKIDQLLARESESLTNRIPEWRDPKIRESEQEKLRGYLVETGYTEDEINNAYDSRTIQLARKAYLYDQMKSKSDVAKKKVVKLGKKVLKPGTTRSKAQQANDAMLGARSKLKSSGKVDDAAAAIRQLRQNRR